MVLLTTLSLVALALPAPQAQSDRIPVLVVSGANNHDWKWTTPSLAQILEEADRFDVEVTYDPAKDLADAEKLASKKAVVLDYNGKRWGDAAEETFLAAVENGLGVVVIHAADNHGNGWDEYEKLVGDLWRKGTGHGRFHPFDITVVDREHPVTATLPTILQHPDELYHNLVNVHGVDRRVLASAFSTKESGGTGEDEPMILVRDYGEGRMFHTPLGHVWTNNAPSQASHRDPQFRGLVVRGTEWAATGMVRDGWDITNGLEDMVTGAEGSEWLMNRSLWQSFSGGEVGEGWRFDGGLLVRTARAGDIVTKKLYENFELTFDWKATVAGNSGIKYRIPADAKQAIGPEFQLLDPAATTKNMEHRAGALYDVIPTRDVPYVPWGEFHTAKIVVRGTKIEHWVDGVMTVNVDTSSPEWAEAVKNSKFKDREGFAAAGPGRILVQDHGDEVWIRNMRIRELESDPKDADGWAPVFEDTNLDMWSNVGDATYAVVGDTLIGNAGPNRQQSFLVSNEELADFAFEVDVKIAVEGNSGIQIRSHVNDKGRLYGYQAEIDPSPRAWSAGLFDEGRRGWLDDLKDNDPAREAFDLTGWNRYRIVCDGPRIRTWINGVPAADLLDGEDLSGSLAFQIHGGDDDIQIHWRDARLQRGGRHEWAEFPYDTNEYDLSSARGIRTKLKGAIAVELRFEDEAGELLRVASIGSHNKWKADAFNRVTVLREGDRVVVQLGDRTIYDFELPGVAKVAVCQPLADPEVDGRWRCVRVRD